MQDGSGQLSVNDTVMIAEYNADPRRPPRLPVPRRSGSGAPARSGVEQRQRQGRRLPGQASNNGNDEAGA